MEAHSIGLKGVCLSILSTVSVFIGLGLPVQVHALELSTEITALNKEFNGSLGYPIMVVDKADFQKRLMAKGLGGTASERDITRELYFYAREKHGIDMPPDEAAQLAPYFLGRNGSASAMPFFTDNVRREQMKYCVVLPSGLKTTHLQDIKRAIGADGQEELFKGIDVLKLQSLMTQQELELFSLYHELSHCLDQKFLRGMYEFETDPHDVHLAESFAEVNALLLLNQRHGFDKLGAARSLLRQVYSKYYGPAIAANKQVAFSVPVAKAGGSIYFLSPVLLAGQKEIDNRRVQNISLDQTLELSKMLVEQHALPQRSFQALNMMMTDGAEKIVPHYQKLANKSPRHFLQAYQDLLFVKSTLDSLDLVIPGEQ